MTFLHLIRRKVSAATKGVVQMQRQNPLDHLALPHLAYQRLNPKTRVHRLSMSARRQQYLVRRQMQMFHRRRLGLLDRSQTLLHHPRLHYLMSRLLLC